MIILGSKTPETDRKGVFAEHATHKAQHEVVIPPILLPKEERRLYLRESLREDHRFRIHNNPEGAQAKFNKLAKSVFKFFRGTALIFYRDYAGMDHHLPFVFTVGDVHPENFGVMPNQHGVPFFGVNDFDEATLAPFSYDIKRGATGFYWRPMTMALKRKNGTRSYRLLCKLT
ncbi:MAG: DUF2252 family protein [Bacteroidia bacterium]|nr:DUF2252 family protein [Bacteroidia bacterium]